MQGHRKAQGFSVVEVLVVVSTTALMMGMLLPSLHRVRQQARRTVCLNNLRQTAVAAGAYCAAYDERYPLAYHATRIDGTRYYLAWDFNTWKDWSQSPAVAHIGPGLLWMGQTIEQVQQCPTYRGSANWLEDPYTGYNYNTSYIGGNETAPSARSTDVRRPAETALFGDGEYAGGANKFMRAPYANPRDELSNADRHAGVQGFRHFGTTNVAFCDGHAEPHGDLHTTTDRASRDILESHNQAADVPIGFLSVDNRLYDLK
jgi:prepilin-type processing-associated H-X9-DG protein